MALLAFTHALDLGGSDVPGNCEHTLLPLRLLLRERAAPDHYFAAEVHQPLCFLRRIRSLHRLGIRFRAARMVCTSKPLTSMLYSRSSSYEVDRREGHGQSSLQARKAYV